VNAPLHADATRDALIAARDLRVGYGGVPLLPGLDLEIQPGQVWALLGHNGAGKTTLLRTLLGLLPPVAGVVVRGASTHIGYVPQRSELDLSVPSRVIDMVRTGHDRGWSFLRPLPGRGRHTAVESAMRDTRVWELARQPFAALSEGQKQRVLFARALVSSPRLLVLDEPTSAMDKQNEDALFALIDELREARDLGVLIITHDIERALLTADHLIFVDKERGVVLAGARTQVSREPAFLRQFGAFLERVARRPGGD